MASIGHLAVGLCLGRYLLPAASPMKNKLGMGILAALQVIVTETLYVLPLLLLALWPRRQPSQK
jgi:hypothetical protein